MEDLFQQLQQKDDRITLNHHIICFYCRAPVAGYVNSLHRHVNDHIRKNHFDSEKTIFDCTFPQCDCRYGNFYSLKRHILEKHPTESHSMSAIEHQHELLELFNLPDNTQKQQRNTVPELVSLEDITKVINISVCRMTADVGLPHTKIKDFVNLCETIVHHITSYLKEKILEFYNNRSVNINPEDSIFLQNLFSLDQLFDQVKTFSSQTKFLNKLAVSMPVARELLLNRREDVRHVNSVPRSVLVNETASYISVVDTLKLIFRNPETRKLLAESYLDSSDTPCVTEYSSFKTGETYKQHEFFRRFPESIRLTIYQDDVELGNAFSSRAGINKVCNFSFKIQNIPEKWNSSPRTVFPLLYCNSIDVKKHGYRKILEPLISDLKRLENGITVSYGAQKFTLQAIVTIFCGDTLAVHDVFELLGPSANFFCRLCQVSREIFHKKPLVKHPSRTRDWYESNLSAVQHGLKAPKDCGLKVSGCILNELQFFHISDNHCLDPMHDLAEGVVPLTVQLVLAYYYSNKETKLSAKYINDRMNNFIYGYADRHNKPSSNFTDEMLLRPSKHKIKQTASQTFLLLRAFPFLFGHKLAKKCPYMQMIGNLINIVRIIISPVVSEHLLSQLDEHISQFENVFYDKFDRKINKLHHLKHYSTCIRKSGAMKQYNCLQFEQTNKMSKNQAATCRNFKNIGISLAKRHCFRMVLNILDHPFCDQLTYKSGQTVNRLNCMSESYIPPHYEFVYVPKTVLLNGIEFRPNLIVGLKNHENILFPVYGIIREIVVLSGKTFFLLRMCDTTDYNEFYEAYELQITKQEKFIGTEDCFTHAIFSFWIPYNCSQRYISRRCYNRDY
ncbi:uncharacterized protein LOC129725654 isoform X1 [Wyeomyia smithii]|uniref:uncharacterized protein LOC129725654 isoform X1 n=1 Tax=Wyeomyia smithii TaxID=174621 RepID=UPI002467B870|nr:uncharacterized protein LOC129725654 isoform X1 [Wyeomyia smithii]